MSDLLITRAAAIVAPYRYCLTRDMHRQGSSAAVVMVNPSTADGEFDDATIRRLYRFAESHGIGRFAVVNKFAFQATDVGLLRRAEDPVGPLNDLWIEKTIAESDICIVAWGPLAKLPLPLRTRWRAISAIAARAGRRLFCFGTAADGHPRHPLMLVASARLRPWVPPA